ncbi:MAG: hypothetical protein ACKO3G_08580 [Planctomycetaceae bacterium]
MQPAGLAVMILSVGTVTALFAWCVWRVLSEPAAEAEHLHGTELHTPDMDRG